MFNYNWYKNVSTFTIGWIVSLLIWRVIRKVGIETYLETLHLDFSLLNTFIFILFFSIISGIIFGSVQYYNEQFSKRKKSFKSLLFKALFTHVLIMTFLYFLLYLVLNTDILFRDFLQNPIILVNLLYSLLINSGIVFLIHINKLFGKGNLIKLITGEFYKPKEEFRAFIFLDLKSSTKLAETLGHAKYSKLIQDCFYDLSIIEKTNVEIYQYVGDEAVLTFKLKDTKFIDCCLDAFFLFTDQLTSRKEYYISNYGIEPVFKAGMHLGIVTVAEVGNLKREIAYHGDAINIAARIQDQCNIYDKNFLISNAVINYIKNRNTFQLEELDDIILKGKSESTALFSVKRT